MKPLLGGSSARATWWAPKLLSLHPHPGLAVGPAGLSEKQRLPNIAAAALPRPAFPLTSAHRFRGEKRRWREGKQLGGSGEKGRKAERPLCLNPAERKAVAC